MNSANFEDLSRREREVMYFVHANEEVTANMLYESMEPPMTYSGARRCLAILEEKGFLAKRVDGKRYVYQPVASSTEVGLDLIKKAFGSFFKGSPTLGIATFLRREGASLDADELETLEALLRNMPQDDTD